MNELIQTWTIHHLQVIGEATRALSDNLKAQQPQVPWSKIIGMRNILVHLYFGALGPANMMVRSDGFSR